MAADLSEAHSVVEAFLYLLVTPCPTCGHGAVEPEVCLGRDGASRLLGTCRNCGMTEEHACPAGTVASAHDPLSSRTPLNASSDPSLIIDLGQWLTLSSLLEARADAMPDPSERRWHRVRARQCIEEALKFFVPGETIPPRSALYTDTSRRAYREDASRFSRSRLLALRDALPAEGALHDSSSASGRSKWRWWPFRKT